MIERRLRSLWEQLQGKKRHFPHFLAEIRLDGIRGIRDLRVRFDYPVSVIAGGNSSGKSTVLFAAACAYRVPGAGVRDFVPSTLFPDYRPQHGLRQDIKKKITLEFEYLTPHGRQYMRWQRSKGWNRSFGGRRGARQPERGVYLRTLRNLTDPAEVRGVLGMSRSAAPPDENPLTASQVEFAHQMLPFRYSEVTRLLSGKKSLLFAEQKRGTSYSELHMGAGERAILRLSQDLAQLKGALVLIDEVETGLHPWVQQLLLLQLQQLALRNDLQILVTSHSPVVLDSVPALGRIILERDSEGRVSSPAPWRDLIQDALYGRTRDTINLLCEDDAAEGILMGVLDHVLQRQRIRHDAVRIGRNTGASEFATHAAAFRKFGQIDNFVFVLDGDKREGDVRNRIRIAAGQDVPVLFLPGSVAPEIWVWSRLCANDEALSEGLSLDPASLREQIERRDAVFSSASDSESEIAKQKLVGLAEWLGRDVPELCRVVGGSEAQSARSESQRLVGSPDDALLAWRAASRS